MGPIKSKFDCKCKACGKPIKKGENTIWIKGTGNFHPGCDTSKARESAGAKKPTEPGTPPAAVVRCNADSLSVAYQAVRSAQIALMDAQAALIAAGVKP